MNFRFLRLLSTLAIVLQLATLASAWPLAGQRESEWESLALPSVLFARHESGHVVFRVPADWKPGDDELEFTDGDGSSIRVMVEQIGDGMPIKAYTAAVLKQLHALPGGADAVRVRQVQMAGLEGREILFEIEDELGDATRRLIWATVDGPRAVAALFVCPRGRAATIEPLFKATVTTVAIKGRAAVEYDEAREEARLEAPPARVDRVYGPVASEAGLAGAAAALAPIFATSPGDAADLLLDRRPLVRAAAVEAIAASKNASLVPLLRYALLDPDAAVALPAARAVAALPDSVAVAERSFHDNLDGFTAVHRIAAWMKPEDRARLVERLLASVPPSRPSPPAGQKPPPPPANGGVQILGFIARTPAAAPPHTDRLFAALSLLRSVPKERMALPFARVRAANQSASLALALDVALERGERLPAATLVELLAWPSPATRILAARALGEWGAAAQTPALEKALAEAKKPGGTPVDGRLVAELEAAREKIAFRDSLSKPTGRETAIAAGLASSRIAPWVWERYVKRDEAVALAPGHPEVAPFGENVFPAAPTFFVAIPKPADALARLEGALNGVHVGTARDQTNLVLMVSAVRNALGRSVGAAPGGAVSSSFGIDLASPIATAQWTAEGAPDGVARRAAVTLRVADRARFERLVGLYQANVSGIGEVPIQLSAGARLFSLAPALLPFVAQAVSYGNRGAAPGAATWATIARRDDSIPGLPLHVIERVSTAPNGAVTRASAFIAYAGDRAILTADLASMRDVATRLSGRGTALGSDARFRDAAAAGGDVVYLSNIAEREGSGVHESGALSLDPAAWQSTFDMAFDDPRVAGALSPFSISQLEAPRTLLPASTLLYVTARLDAAAVGPLLPLAERDFVSGLASMFAADVARDVMPELGPEIGLALLGLERRNGRGELPAVAFVRLRSDALAGLLREGRLFKGVGPSEGPVVVTVEGRNVSVAVKHGFLVVATTPESLALLDAGERLATAKDFERSAAAVPNPVALFGVSSVDAAFASLSKAPDDLAARLAVTMLRSAASAFHSQYFYVAPRSEGLAGKLSVSLDRESRFTIEEIAASASEYREAFVVLQPRGVSVSDPSGSSA